MCLHKLLALQDSRYTYMFTQVKTAGGNFTLYLIVLGVRLPLFFYKAGIEE